MCNRSPVKFENTITVPKCTQTDNSDAWHLHEYALLWMKEEKKKSTIHLLETSAIFVVVIKL